MIIKIIIAENAFNAVVLVCFLNPYGFDLIGSSAFEVDFPTLPKEYPDYVPAPFPPEALG